MLAGELEAAWQESDAIRLGGGPDPYRFWNGKDLRNAKVIVRCLHGLRDAVQMFKYAPSCETSRLTSPLKCLRACFHSHPFFFRCRTCNNRGRGCSGLSRRMGETS